VSAPIEPSLDPAVRRTVTIGGASKAQLLGRLRSNGIELNASAEQLFADDRFMTASAATTVSAVELTVRDLGLPEGGAMEQIAGRAEGRGLGVCPLELGPHIRLQYVDQPEGSLGQPVRPHQAPIGSITIVSEPLSADDDIPKGFYIRRIEGVLWLRGYVSGGDHVWAPDDHLIFCAAGE
jgi:hypothetical protein